MTTVLKEKECTKTELRDTKGESGAEKLEDNLKLVEIQPKSHEDSQFQNNGAPGKCMNKVDCTLYKESIQCKERTHCNGSASYREGEQGVNTGLDRLTQSVTKSQPTTESVSTPMKEIIRVRCIKHIYPDKTEVSLCGLDFVVYQGERVAILGPNGAGKTTLLNHILGLLKPVEGEVSVFGRQPSKEQREVVKRIGVVFQNSDEQIIGPTVYDDIAFSPRNFGYAKDEIRKMVDEVSKRIGISHLLNKVPHYLSGGQKKKVALAGAMVMRPELLILDEPFNGLDPEAKEEIIELLREINEVYGTAILMTSHDINFLPEIVEKVYILHAGKVVRYGEVGEVLQERDFLYNVSLRPPLLVELFTRLQAKGVPIAQIPINVDQAEEVILRLLESHTVSKV